MMDNLSVAARETISAAHTLAASLGHAQVRPEHLLIAAMRTTTTTTRILAGYGLGAHAALAHLTRLHGREVPPGTRPTFAPTTRTIVHTAALFAQRTRTRTDVTYLVRAALQAPDKTLTTLLSAVHLQPATALAALDAADPCPHLEPPAPTRGDLRPPSAPASRCAHGPLAHRRRARARATNLPACPRVTRRS